MHKGSSHRHNQWSVCIHVSRESSKWQAGLFKETGWFCRFPKHEKLDKWVMAGEKRQTCWPKLRKPAHCNSVKQKYKQILVARKKGISDRYMAYLLMQETSAIEQNSSSRDWRKEDSKEAVTEVSMKLCLVFVCQDVTLWSLSMKDIN